MKLKFEPKMSWLSIIGSAAALGYFIDFWIGPTGQQRLKDRMETWWLKISDMRWHDLGREEALFAVRVMDWLFGSRLFSLHRLMVVVGSTFFFSSIIIILVALGHGGFRWQEFFPLSFPRLLWICLTMLSFATSLSFTRFATIIVVHGLRRVPYLSLFGLLMVIVVQYISLCYWALLANSFMMSAALLYDAFPNTFGVAIPFSMLLQMFVFDMQNRFFTMYEMALQGFRITPSQQFIIIANQFKPDNSDVSPLSFISHLSTLLNLIPNFSRFIIMLVFFVSLLIYPFRRAPMSLWARIIESDKPAFTLLFAGFAAIVKIISNAF